MRRHIRDIKEIVGVLMRVVGGGDVSPSEVTALGFDADNGLEDVVNEAYIKLLEFAYDEELRRNDSHRDSYMRADLKLCLEKIVNATNEAVHNPSVQEPCRMG